MRVQWWWNRRPGYFKLDGGRWPAVIVVEVTPSGILIEAPAEPPLPIGTVRTIEIDGLRGVAIAEHSYPNLDGKKAVYAISVVEHDDGLLAAIARQGRHRGGTLRIAVPDSANAT